MRNLLCLWNAGPQGLTLIETMNQMTLFEKKKCLYSYALCENSPLFLVYFMRFSCGTNSASFSVHGILAGICVIKYIFFPNALPDPQGRYPTELLTSAIVTQGQNPSNRAHCSECSWAKSLGAEKWRVSRTGPLSSGSGRIKRILPVGGILRLLYKQQVVVKKGKGWHTRAPLLETEEK